MSIEIGFPASHRHAPRMWRRRSMLRVLSVGSLHSGRLFPLVMGLLLPALILAAWWCACRQELLAPQILPAPSLVWDTTLDLLWSGDLAEELGVSLARLALGLAVGGMLGVVTGIALGVSPVAEAYCGPSLRAIFLVPSLGWLPFLMLVFGIGEELKFVLIAKTCFLPMMVNIMSAIQARSSKFDEVAKCLELDRRARLRFVVLPALVPALCVGVRQALAKGWKVLILVEMISSAAGIGYLMMWGRKSFQLDVVFSTMVVVAVVGLLFDRFVLFLQRRVAEWSLHASL